MGANASIALRIWREIASRTDSSCGEIDIVKSEQCSRDEKMRATQVKIGNNRRFQYAAGGAVLEIGAVRRDEQARAEKARTLATQSPGHVGRVRFNPLENNSLRQKN